MSAGVMVLATERDLETNTVKVTNMVEAAATYERNMFSEIQIIIKCNTKITYNVCLMM